MHHSSQPPPRALVSLVLAVVLAVAGLAGAAPAGAQEEPGTNTVSAWGSATDHGPADDDFFARPLVGMTKAGRASDAYWLVASDGGVFSYGGAPFYGSAGDIDLYRPIVGMDAHPSGDGYWLVASDGGIFTYGDVAFHGSAGAIDLNEPIVGMAVHPSGDGYWLVASDGGIFTYGDIPFHGSLGDLDLNQPIVGMAAHPSGDGYWLVAADGGVFTFGDVPFYGSMGGKEIPEPVVDMAASPDGMGYWLAGRNGQVYAFGVTDKGSPADDDNIEAPAVGIEAHSADGYWFVHGERRLVQIEDSGPHVERIQRRLVDLGYWLGPTDGVFGELTEQAVYAFQKVEQLPITGEVDRATSDRLWRAARPSPRSTSGDLIEVDKTRQVVFVVRNGQVLWTFNTSTGTEEPYTYEGEQYYADTPNGRWTIFREVDGYRESNLGRLYRPKYFHEDGIALHGYSFVPPYPASHGCVRVTNPAIDYIWAHGLAPIGGAVWVYGTTPGQ